MTPAQAQHRILAEANQQMVSRREVESLLERETRPDSPVLSVYLDTDQSNVGNVNRAFEVVFKNMLRDIRQPEDKEKHKQIKDDADRVLRFLDDYRDPQRALV